MRLKIIILYLLCLHTFVAVTIVKTDIIARIYAHLGGEIKTPELTDYYYLMLAFHKRIDKNVVDNSVIFIGDSITQGLAVSAVYPHSVNFGIGLDTTLGVLKRLPFYHSILQSKLLVITIGVNDLSRRTNKDIIYNYRQIITLIPKQTTVLFNAIFPIDEHVSKNKGYNKRIRILNKQLDNLCKSRNKLYFMDISKYLIADDNNLSINYHLGDGIHLNRQGNALWISELKNYINRISKESERI